MYENLVINVDELWLKGMNRPMYFQALRRHIKELFKAYHPAPFSLTNETQRLVAVSETPFDEATLQALARVPGIHSFMPARRIEGGMDAIFPVVKQELEHYPQLPQTFKVETHRSYKGFPLTSMEVSKEIGAQILAHFPALKVDVKHPQLLVEIRILDQYIYISTRKIPCTGGLPVGTSGHLLTLLSGGFDSAVASYLMARRGCRQSFAFFYAYPFVGEEVKEKILKLVAVLGRFFRSSRLYIVAFGNIQDQIAKVCRPDYRTILFRRSMVQCAELLARKIHADALLTGDSLGQVSSQTLDNMALLDKSVQLPIFRPLLGYNKVDIINLARVIGTHDISIIPHDDACSLFAPRHPVTRPDRDYVERFAEELPLTDLLKKSIELAEVHNITLTGKVSCLHPVVVE